MGAVQWNRKVSPSVMAWASVGQKCFVPPSPIFMLLLLFLMLNNVAESVPTAEFLVTNSGNSRNSEAGGKEMAISGRSLYWSSVVDTQLEKRSRDVQPIQLCGYRLLEAVRGLCRGNYVGYNRRSDPEMRGERVSMMMMRDASAPEDSPDTTYYTTGHSDSTDSFNSNRMRGSKSHLRFRRNIIDECCKKPCSVNEMLRYCGRN